MFRKTCHFIDLFREFFSKMYICYQETVISKQKAKMANETNFLSRF